MNYEQAVKLILDSLKEGIDDTTEESRKLNISNASSETRLFGGNGLLDSLGVVILLTDLEEKLDEEFDVTVSLASDSTMSRTRSPFRTVKSLAEYMVLAVMEECES
jgi:acyl carrier protein